MRILIDFKMEDIEFEQLEDGVKIIKLPELTDEEKNIIDPLVAPTSGLRIQILATEKEGEVEKIILPKRKFYLFLRVFKAISQKFKESKGSQNLKIPRSLV